MRFEQIYCNLCKLIKEIAERGDRNNNKGDLTGQGEASDIQVKNGIPVNGTPQNGRQNVPSTCEERGVDTEKVMYDFVIGISSQRDEQGDNSYDLDNPSVKRVQADLTRKDKFKKILDFFKKKKK